MTTTAHPMVKFTAEELEGLGPAENLPTIQHITASPSNALRPTTAQLPMPSDYKGVTKLNEDRLRTDLLRVKVDSEGEPSPSVSDSEDEHDAVPKTLDISERRKVQNSKFSAWCVPFQEVLRSGVNAHRTQ